MSNRMTVKSSNIASFDFHQYEGADVGTLTVQFRNGRTYAYQSVPATAHEALVAEALSTDEDASVGKAFGRLVRNAGFEYEEVES